MFSRFGHSLASCDDYRPLLGLELTDNLAAGAVAVAVDMAPAAGAVSEEHTNRRRQTINLIWQETQA